MKMTVRVAACSMALFLLALGVRSAAPVEVPPPKDEAALKQMMRISWDQKILPPGAQAKTLQRLLVRGEVVLMNDSPPGGIPWMAAAGILVDAPAETVFKTVMDHSHYTDFVPMTGYAHSAPVPNFPNLYRVDFKIELLFSWLTVDYGTYDYRRPPLRSDWCHRVGEFSVDSGFWEMIPTEDGQRTMAFYSVFARPRQSAVQALYRQEPALELMTNVATATMIVRAIKTEAERRTGKKLPALKEPASVEQILMDDPETLHLLAEKGKIMVCEPGPTVYVTSGVVVKAPVKTAYSVITDFTKYPQFLPGYKKSEIVGQGKKGPIIRTEVSIKLWEFNFDTSAEQEMELAPPDRVLWQIKRSNAPPVPGFWRIIPLSNDTKSLIFSGNTQDIRNMGLIPRTALRLEPTLEYGLLAAQMTAGMDAFKKRIEQVQQKGGK